MNRVAHFRTLLAYEADATARVAAAIDSIPSDRCGETAAIRARGILAHIQSARHEWLFRLGHITRRPWVMFPDWSAAETLADAQRLDREWGAYLEQLTDADLERRVEYRSNEGHPFSSTIAEILTHVFNHSTYHRGQVALLIAQCGGQRPVTDFIAFTRRKGS